VPKTMEEMLTIPGAARKTANVVLGTAYGIAAGVVVDTHVSRIAQRLDLTQNTDAVKTEQDLIKNHSAGTLDLVFAPDHPARPGPLRGTQSAVRRVRLNDPCYAADKTCSAPLTSQFAMSTRRAEG